MTTNFTLNKKMKEKLAYDLTAKAVEKKMKALEKKLVKLNTEFWVHHDKTVADVLKIDKKRYNELQLAGALLCTTGVIACNLENSKSGIGETLLGISNEVNRRLQTHVTKFINRNGNYYSHLKLMFVNNYSVPTLNRETLKLADSRDCPFYKKADELLGEYISIIKSSHKFHSDVKQIIMPIRSYRVLLDRFPEAAKLLPAPAKAAGNMIPVELINDVRERLKSGIPL